MSDVRDLEPPFKAEAKDTKPDDASDQQSVLLERVLATSFQGPLPPPSVLREYNQIVPHGAERIFAAFENQVEHRHKAERQILDAEIRLRFLGLVAAFLLSALVIVGGLWLAFLGKSLAGMAAILAALASLITVFLVGRQRDPSDPRSKEEDVP